MEKVKKIAKPLENMKERKVRTLIILTLFPIIGFCYSLDTLKITVILNDKVIVDRGSIISSKVTFLPSEIIDHGRNILLKSNSDSTNLVLKFKKHVGHVSIRNDFKSYFIEISKPTYRIDCAKLRCIKDYLKMVLVCRPYSIVQYNNSGWTSIFTVLSKKCEHSSIIWVN